MGFSLFRRPPCTAEGILGGRPQIEEAPLPESVVEHLRSNGLLEEGEGQMVHVHLRMAAAQGFGLGVLKGFLGLLGQLIEAHHFISQTMDS